MESGKQMAAKEQHEHRGEGGDKKNDDEADICGHSQKRQPLRQDRKG